MNTPIVPPSTPQRPPEIPTEDGDRWQDFFEVIRVSEDQYNNNTIYYLNLFTKYQADFVAAASEKTFEAWLRNNSDISSRQQSPFLWAFHIFLTLYIELQHTALIETARGSMLTQAQETITKEMSAFVKIEMPTGPGDTHHQAENMEYQARFTFYQQLQNVWSAKTTALNGAISGANQSISTASKLMDSVITNMQSIIRSIYS